MSKTSNARTSGQVAFVTGASAGIGQATALALSKVGYRVFGTSRKADNGGIVDGIEMVRCDVTSDESVAAAIAHLQAKAGTIDLLINNAGAGILAAAEESSIEQLHRLFDTNFYGTVRMVNAVLPIMRRQGSGRIINMSSILGLIPAPFSAYYAATKHAIEGYSESLDHEVRGFGVRIALVEPGYTRSSFEQSMAAPDQPLSVYDAARANASQMIADNMKTADTSESVAETIVRAASAKHPYARYTSGKGVGRLALLRRWVPAPAFDKSLRRQMRLPQ